MVDGGAASRVFVSLARLSAQTILVKHFIKYLRHNQHLKVLSVKMVFKRFTQVGPLSQSQKEFQAQLIQ